MKVKTILAPLAVLLIGTGCSCRSATPAPLQVPAGKAAIVVYSESKNHNTWTIAAWIQRQTGGDLYEIVPETPYSTSYRAVLKESQAQMEAGEHPAILPFDTNFSAYDVIFLGSPIWYDTYAPPVGTFLEHTDLTGKTVAPFCTHGGGGPGRFYADIAAQCPDARILEGYTGKGSNILERIIGRGTRSKEKETDIIKWLRTLALPTHPGGDQ